MDASLTILVALRCVILCMFTPSDLEDMGVAFKKGKQKWAKPVSIFAIVLASMEVVSLAAF